MKRKVFIYIVIDFVLVIFLYIYVCIDYVGNDALCSSVGWLVGFS